MKGQTKVTVTLAELNKEMPLLDEVADEIANLTRSMNPVEIVTPVNAKAEQEKWLEQANEGHFTDPSFHYDQEALNCQLQNERELTKLYDKLQSFKSALHGPAEKLVYKLLTMRIEDALLTIKLARAILAQDDIGAGKVAAKKYGLPTQSLITAAWNQLERLQKKQTELCTAIITVDEQDILENRKFLAPEIAVYFKKALNLYGLDWTVRVDPVARAIDVRDKSASEGHIIVIPQDRKVSGLKLLELIGHEIECHVRDSENGSALLHGLGGGPLKTDCETLYEGHAKLADIAFARKYQGTIQEAPNPWYILAMNMAQKNLPFSEVSRKIFEYRRDIESTDKALKGAWTTAYRIFRGCSHLKNPFGYVFPKDKAYLEGYLMAADLEKSGLEHWLEIGVLSPEELLTICSVVKFSDKDLKYPYQDAVKTLCQELLSKLT